MKTQTMTRRALMGLLVAAATPALAADSTSAARREAEAWLALVDGGSYDESWERAATYFKQRVTAAQWKQAASSVREPLGKLASRELIGAQQTNKLPGAPDGDYVVIQFRADFANKKGAVETITPMKEASGEWRVSGYYVR